MSAAEGIVAALARTAGPGIVLGEDALGWAELAQRAAAVAARMPPAASGSEVAFAFGGDRLAFVTALLATWMRGHTAVLPEDASRERVAPLLARPGHALLVHDTGVGRGLFVPRIAAEAGAADADGGAPFPASRAALVAVRGRSIGEPVERAWSASELLADLDGLAARLELAPGEAVASTLTPTALPGALAGALVPLRAGARFAPATASDPAAAAARARDLGAAVLVTSAAHARVLAQLAPGALVGLRKLVCVDERPGERALALLEGRHGLSVAPLTELAPAEPLAPELDALRAGLLAYPAVRDAALLEVPDADGARVLVAVAADGAAAADVGALVARALPGRRHELAVLARIPRDANGRPAAAALLLAFGRGRAGVPLVRELAWTEVPGGDAATRRFRARLPAAYAFFEGHFTGHPVLAGAVQLHELVLPCARRFRPAAGPLARLSRVKFQARVVPGEEIEVELRGGTSPDEIAFVLSRAGETCAQGRLHFRPEGGA